jgi:hypothetical protein
MVTGGERERYTIAIRFRADHARSESKRTEPFLVQRRRMFSGFAL